MNPLWRSIIEELDKMASAKHTYDYGEGADFGYPQEYDEWLFSGGDPRYRESWELLQRAMEEKRLQEGGRPIEGMVNVPDYMKPYYSELGIDAKLNLEKKDDKPTKKLVRRKKGTKKGGGRSFGGGGALPPDLTGSSKTLPKGFIKKRYGFF
jgi:hypothetical protein